MKFLFLPFFLFSALIIQAQTKIINAVVIDAESKLPLANCNVLISNTSKGTTTDESGRFTLNNIPDGNYLELIVSLSGHQSYVYQFSSKQLPLNLSISLTKKVIEMQNVVISRVDPNGWEKWGDEFMKNFIGESENAHSCKIGNPAVLKFRYDKKENTIDVSADSVLIIENHRLGYVIKYQLEGFKDNLNTGIINYLGYPLFDEMEKDSLMRTAYSGKRLKAYNGSVRHFIQCIYNNRLAAEGFKVQRMRPEQGYAVLGNDGRTIQIDITDSATKKNKTTRKKQKSTLEKMLLSADDLLFKGKDSIKNVLSFDDYLYVTYTREAESTNYNMFPEYSQASKLYILNEDKKIFIEPNGHYSPALDLLIGGYMGWEKIGDLLPIEYAPPVIKKRSRK